MPRSKEIQEQMRSKIVDLYQSGREGIEAQFCCVCVCLNAVAYYVISM